MTPKEIGELIISRWHDNLTISQIKTVLVGRGIILKRWQVAAVVRSYCDHADQGKCNIPCDPDFDIQSLIR